MGWFIFLSQEPDSRLWPYVYPSKYPDAQKQIDEERWKEEREQDRERDREKDRDRDRERDRKGKDERPRPKDTPSKEESKEGPNHELRLPQWSIEESAKIHEHICSFTHLCRSTSHICLTCTDTPMARVMTPAIQDTGGYLLSWCRITLVSPLVELTVNHLRKSI